ncbi:hypothetical protein H0I76_00775 [Limibaculum sp. M0105]|uniref:EF-hand domain-containing protein n=1 Tax=Thermohalobaculum xanthum TaxID=2753746 RepID=A0A8J7SBL3_9RHOB|nr:hypothetical protein [Thermohalobaculum xanthum]MBK0397711.1 hypothetical protein [Thermohalobaculum xanthum]
MKLFLKPRAALCVAGLLAVSACNSAPEPAYIPPPPPPNEGPVWTPDTNGDGTIDSAEWKASGDATHAKLDTNSDGVVTEVEIGTSFDALDHDGDGVLTSKEMYVDELDKDRDAQITRSEWAAGSLHQIFDYNQDGHVSQEELQMRRGEQFKINDEDGNGRLSDLEISGNNVKLFSF